MGKTKSGETLGKSLQKSRKKDQNPAKNANAAEAGYLHSADLQDGYDWGRMNLQSVTEEASYIDFLNTAEQASQDFDAEKWNVQLLDAQTRKVYIDTSKKSGAMKPAIPEDQGLSIPRRPAWTGLTAIELRNEENESFLDWRRNLSKIQEETETVITPYEKNLEFWRQLWRVIERSELVVQIVDCRNPLLFRSKDLEAYVKEVSTLKQNLILLNKADFLNEEQRMVWGKYFKENIGDTKFAFFSAIEEDDLDSIDEENAEEDTDLEKPNVGVNPVSRSRRHQVVKDTEAYEDNEDKVEGIKEDVDTNYITEDFGKREEVKSDSVTNVVDEMADKCKISSTTDESNKSSTDDKTEDEKFANECRILSSQELMDLFREFKRYDSDQITVGFIGYPNVGKSSTINKLLNSKKVRVSETPGKTKHFQTHDLADDITLCDCPGLVMPSIVASKADMVLNGILPVSQLRDHVPSIKILLDYIPTHVLEYTYGLVLPQEPEVLGVEQLLTAYAILRGFMAIGGRVDQSRGARIILKDFVAGKVLFCKAPPKLVQADYHVYERQALRVWLSEEAKDKEVLRQQQQKKRPAKVLDDKFFNTSQVGTHVKGRSMLSATSKGRLTDMKKEKKFKKIKARIMHSDLDPKHVD